MPVSAAETTDQPHFSQIDLNGDNFISKAELTAQAKTVRHQRFWIQRPRNLSAYLAHLVDSIMRRTCGVASAGI